MTKKYKEILLSVINNSNIDVLYNLPQMLELSDNYYEDNDKIEYLVKNYYKEKEGVLPLLFKELKKKSLLTIDNKLEKAIKQALSRGVCFYGPAMDWDAGLLDFPEDKVGLDYLDRAEDRQKLLLAILVKSYDIKH